MKKLMLIGATIVAGLIAYVSLLDAKTYDAGAGRVWELQGSPSTTQMTGIFFEVFSEKRPDGSYSSVTFNCIEEPLMICWTINGRYFDTNGIGSPGSGAASGTNGTVES